MSKSQSTKNTQNVSQSNAELSNEKQELHRLIESQREYFSSGITLPVSWRKAQLKKLYASIKKHEADIFQALKNDLNKSEYEAFTTESGFILREISHHLKCIKKWSRTKKIRGDEAYKPAKYNVITEPFGITLIASPWNYPFLLSFQPLISALAAGNTAIIKTSEYSPASNKVIEQIVSETFPSEYVSVVQGGYIQNQLLLHEKFDFIFFTGSSRVGKSVMEAAAKTLTPVCLELGGKCPCIVEEDAPVAVTARRIVWGKFLNAGQTCVAPDYILVHESKKQALIKALEDEVFIQYGENPLTNEDYPKIINSKHFSRLFSMAPDASADPASNKIAPTILDLGSIDSSNATTHPSMKEEIFGPILPVITYTELDEALDFIRRLPVPLSLYLFTRNKLTQKRIVSSMRFGGGCINDVLCHLGTSKIPFGGCGESGMGMYHGKYGFDTFSRRKSILIQSHRKDRKLRYGPHKKISWTIRLFFR